MVDVGAKKTSRRRARAQAVVQLTPEAVALFDGRDLQSRKGPVFHAAILAGIMAAKRTHELIPLCHPLPLDDCLVHIRLEVDGAAVIEAAATAEARTGVEMEAMTAASIAALTLYDMVKSLGLGTVIREVRLLEKTGGKSDFRAQGARAAKKTPRRAKR
jgi:cyclic pyranopterin phosphate synthase